MRLAVATTVILTIISTAAFGCKCAAPPPGVESGYQLAEWRAKGIDAIFEGRVVRAELKSAWVKASVGDSVPANLDEDVPTMLVTFDVTRSYRGVEGPRVDVETGLGGGDCGFGFDIGRQYLVYADRGESGQLSTGICDATAPIEQSATNLAYLRGESVIAEKPANQPKAGGSRLCVRIAERSSEHSDDERVFLSRVANRSPIPTDEAEPKGRGLFCADDLDPGEYRLLVAKMPDDAPTSFTYYPGVTKFSEATALDVRPGQIVSNLSFTIPSQPTLSVSGTVSVTGGSKLPHKASVILISAEQPFSLLIYLHDVAPDGSFAIPKVLAGKYWGFVDVESDTAGTKWSTRKVQVTVEKNVTNLHLALIRE
jgi:hypothetical protein